MYLVQSAKASSTHWRRRDPCGCFCCSASSFRGGRFLGPDTDAYVCVLVVHRLSLAQMNLHRCSDGRVRLVCRDETLPRDSYDADAFPGVSDNGYSDEANA